MNFKIKVIAGSLFLFCLVGQAQSITMQFPAFTGKTYDFIIFQGDKPIIAQQDTIPKEGKFVLTIPKQYAPYTGMCRWLITGTKEGGGLDMPIPGYDFSVTCLEKVPNESNIVYKGYDAANELNRLNREQLQIIEKHSTMVKALSLYDKKSQLYKTFEAERKVQEEAFATFQQQLATNKNYAARFLSIVNITKGIAPKLYAQEEDKFAAIAHYFAYDVNMDALYTSGHWSGIIASWVQIQQHVIKNDSILYKQFATLTSRISDKKRYTDLTGKVTYYMKTYGMDKQIEVIAPIVVNSGKITEYAGTMEVYIKALTGSQAPDLVITEPIGHLEVHDYKTTVLKSSELTTGNYKQTLLVFYRSDCGPCEELMPQLLQQYETLKTKGIRVITLSADQEELIYQNSSKDYPWPDKYCDFKGTEGVNFKNYAVKGTPTLVLLDRSGKILMSGATLKEIVENNIN